MYKVAVTGNMGSGKTTVCKVFEILGVPVFYADNEAKALYNNPAIAIKVKQEFGDTIYNTEGSLNRPLLAKIIFNDPLKMKILSEIIHPEVQKRFTDWQRMQPPGGYCIQEAAILFETGAHRNFNQTLLIYAPESLLIQRVTKRDSMNVSQAQQRLKNQMNQQEKKEIANHIIINDNSQLIIPQILELHKEFSQMANTHL